MKIEWKLDDESEWDPFSLLGSIKLIDELGNWIEDRIIYLDSWFISINEGLGHLSDGKNIDVDLIDEPDPLVFLYKNDEQIIRYKNQEIYLYNVSDAVDSLKNEVTKFIEIVVGYPGPRDEATIIRLRKIIEK